MYDTTLTRQALPPEQYRMLLGTALCVFNSNNQFIIENVLRIDDTKSWFELIDKEAGKVEKYTRGKLPEKIVQLFSDLVEKRNRIIHSFRITNKNGEQPLATKEKNSDLQYEITEEYLLTFIRIRLNTPSSRNALLF